ncbi:hypothetical protein NKR19_g9769 [Coniochaeta hoffmannii]|uniref:Uncharacterized protein n=1 Tax=Coniochaeta hoffmannii TaxID=91930 RepID=A0AA38VD42_9PEZI|nr:hypothetical protein NKR19_g9769 [Coniochaeta hoffmannii]
MAPAILNNTKSMWAVAHQPEPTLESRLERETERYRHTRALLNDTVAALDEEKTMHLRTQHQLKKKDLELEDVRKRWREAANQLDRFMRQDQGID